MRLLLVALVVEAFLIVASQTDIPASDPLAYAENAYAIERDPQAAFAHPPNHPFAMRIGLTVPLAGVYRVLGVNGYTTDLIPLLAALAIICAVFFAVPAGRARQFALLFGVTATLLVRQGSVLGVDVLCTALLAWSLLLLAKGRLSGAMALWFAAFLVKESAIWIAPAWAYALYVDSQKVGWRTAVRAYVPALAVGLALAGLYLWFCAWAWGDPLARFAGVQELANEHRWSLGGKGAGVRLHRLTWGPPLLLVTTFGAVVLLAPFGPRHLPRPERTWVVATLSVVLLFWFGSAGTSTFEPLPLLPRMLLPALPGIVVLAAVAAERYARRPLAIAAVVAAAVVPCAFAVVPGLFPARPETAAYAALRADVARGGPVVLVCGDVRCPSITNFHFGFAPPASLTIVYAADFAPVPGARVRALVNRPRTCYLEQAYRADYGEQDRTQMIEALHLPALWTSRDVTLYDAGDGAALHAK